MRPVRQQGALDSLIMRHSRKTSALRTMPRLCARIAALLIVAPVCLASLALSESTKLTDPPLPPGRDPGGRPVAWIGQGLDYTSERIRNRLARDGEGELTGYDFVDDDRRPYLPDANDESRAAARFLSESQTGTLVVLRHDGNDPKTLFQAIGYAARTPARLSVILADITDTATSSALFDAARHFPEHVFLTGPLQLPADRTLPANIIRVGQDASSNRHHLADLAAAGSETGADAKARIAALVVRLLAVEPELTADQVRPRILQLARNDQNDADSPSAIPLLDAPARHFWLE